MKKIKGQKAENKQASPADSDPRFNKFIDAGVQLSLGHIRENYENRKNLLENLAFHNAAHTKTILRRVDKILADLDADARTRSRAKLHAGFHDPVQNWKIKMNEKGYTTRDCSPFPNEEDS